MRLIHKVVVRGATVPYNLRKIILKNREAFMTRNSFDAKTAYENSLSQYYFDLADEASASYSTEFALNQIEQMLTRCCRHQTPRREAEFVFRITQKRMNEYDA